MSLKVKSKGILSSLLTALDPVPKWEGRVTDVKIGCNEAGNFFIHVAMNNKTIRYHFYSEGYIQCFRDDGDGKGMIYVKTIGGGYKKPTLLFKRICTCISKLTHRERRPALCL